VHFFTNSFWPNKKQDKVSKGLTITNALAFLASSSVMKENVLMGLTPVNTAAA
jgi:hypothetical protein